MHSTKGNFLITKQETQNMWKDRNIARVNEPIWTRAIGSLHPGHNLKYEIWKTLNRLRLIPVQKTLIGMFNGLEA